MAGISKVMLWALGDSISFSYLSWKAKIAWPCLLSKTDEQGRYVAEPKIFKGILCSLVEEIQPEDVDAILSEFKEQGMIVTYESDGLLLGQVVNRWKYNKPPYAARSKYPPPEGWTDRIHEKEGDEHIFENWKTKGGFGVENSIEQNSIVQYRGDMGISSSSDKQETRKTSKKKKDKTLEHEAFKKYNGILCHSVSKAKRRKLIKCVEKHGMEPFEGVLEMWRDREYNPDNIKGICEAVERRAKSGKGQRRDKRSGPTPTIDYDEALKRQAEKKLDA